ncbi:MAG: hypothetical protein D4S02_01310 [Rhodocyclaceae bacterium]|nr:MAG: hypothetical protein D4S02_01310 [Rhodocyclaceae bacterium]
MPILQGFSALQVPQEQNRSKNREPFYVGTQQGAVIGRCARNGGKRRWTGHCVAESAITL